MTTASLARQAARPEAVLAIVLTSYLMIVLDISIVITGLPEIRDGLGFSAVGLSWVQNAYMLSFGGLLLLAARAGDVLGRKRMFLAGLGLFTIASLAIGMAPTPAVLVAARAVQGVGAAILAPSVLALIATHFPEGRERTRALAYYSMVAGVGSSLGLVLGGIFAGQLSWRVGFFVNVPIGVALMLTARRVIDETDRARDAFDLPGAVTSTLGMGVLVYGIVRSADTGLGDELTRAALVAAALLLAFFLLVETRARQPVLPLRLFASRERVGGYLGRMLFVGAIVGFFFFTTLFMQGVLGFSPVQAGLGFLPMTVPTLVAAMLVPALASRLGNAGLLTLALALGAGGMLWLGRAGQGADYATAVALPMILIGLGNGFALGPLTVAGVAGVAPGDSGAASGLVNVAHQIGGALGLGLLVVVFASTGLQAPLAGRIGTALTGAAAFLAVALVLVLATRPRSASAAVGTPREADALACQSS